VLEEHSHRSSTVSPSVLAALYFWILAWVTFLHGMKQHCSLNLDIGMQPGSGF
jgi:hypothetical protein